MTVYFNTYRIHQRYGGPEEGGWWYEVGEPVQSVLVSNQDYEEWIAEGDEDRERLYELDDETTETLWQKRHKALKAFQYAYDKGEPPTPTKTEHGGYVFMPGSEEPTSFHQDNDYNTVYEEHFAAPYPTETPHYE